MQPLGQFNPLTILEMPPTSKGQSRIEAINMLNNLFTSTSLKNDIETIENYLKEHEEVFEQQIDVFNTPKVDFDRMINVSKGSYNLIGIAARLGLYHVAKFLIKECSDVSLLNQGILTPIYIAAAHGHTQVVKLFIETGVDYKSAIQKGKFEGTPPIHIAAAHGHTEVLKLLIECGVDCKLALEKGAGKGITPIYIAAAHGHAEAVKLLINNGADCKLALEVGCWEGATPIYIAAANGYIDVVKLLIDNGADCKMAVEKGRYEGLTPIYSASNQGHTEVVKLLIENKVDYAVAIQTGKSKGLTPIIMAVDGGCIEVVKLLIDNGVDCKLAIEEGDYIGLTPIFSAVKKGNTEIVKLLIDRGVDCNLARENGNNKGLTPIYLAARYGHVELVKLLIENKVDYESAIQTGEHEGITPIFIAAEYGHTEVVKLLIDKGVNCNLALEKGDLAGLTPINISANKGHAQVVKLLIDNGVNGSSAIETGNNKGSTPIYIATLNGHTEVVKVLIENKVNCETVIQAEKHEGLTPICLAAYYGHTQIVKLLIEKGVDCNFAVQGGISEGLTPIYIAADKGHVDIIKLFIENGVDCNAAIQRGSCEGLTPVYVSVINGNIKVLKLFIDNNVNCNLPIQRGLSVGLTPITAAVAAGNTELAKLLIENKVDYRSAVQSGKSKGKTPIFIAASSGYTEIVKLLIENGVDYHSTKHYGDDNKEYTLVDAAIQNGNTPVVKLLIEHDVLVQGLSTMPPCMLKLCSDELNRMNLITGLLRKKDQDKKFTFAWYCFDNLVYLSVKTPSALFCERGRRILENKGIKVQMLINNEEIQMKKSQANLFVKFFDEWIKSCKLLDQLSKLFERRIIDQFTPAENGIVLNLNPIELGIYESILKIINAKVEGEGHVFISFEFMNCNDLNFAELRKSANKKIEKLNKVQHLANTHGKAKIEYTDKELKIRFKDEHNLKKFAQKLTFCKTTENCLELICAYEDILGYNFEVSSVDRKATCIASFKRALELLIPNYNRWSDRENCIEAELVPHYLAILEPLSISGLSILEHKKIRMMVENLEQFSEEEFSRISSGVKENQNKMSAFERVFRKISAKEGRLLNEKGYVFCFKDDDHKKCFESQFENVLVKAEGDNQFLMTYSNILQLDQDKLLLVLKNMEKLTPVVQVVRPPVQSTQAASYNNGPLVAVKKVQKNKKKNKKPKTPVESKPSAVDPATKKSKGPNIPPQREIVWPKIERTGPSGMVQAAQEIDYTRKKIVPSVVLMNEKVELTDYEACIKHELEFLKGLCKWYDELDNDSKNDYADLYCDSLWLGLLRFYNGVYMRAKNAHKNYQKIVHLTSNDMDAKKIRACLIHYFRERKNLTEHYEKYVVESMGKIVENDYKLPNQKVELMSLSSCLLLQECKTIDDFYPMVKEQFSLIGQYLNILKEKADKQAKVLSDVFKCAVEGDMTDSSFRFLVHEAKAIEACLVKIGELHRHIKGDPKFNKDIMKFIAKCRKLRNRITHVVGEDLKEGYNPISAETISRFAAEAKSLIEKF